MESKYLRQFDEKKDANNTTNGGIDADESSFNTSGIYGGGDNTNNQLQYESFESKPFDFMRHHLIGSSHSVHNHHHNLANSAQHRGDCKQLKNGFVLYQTPAVGQRPEEEELQASLLEMEQRLFGISRQSCFGGELGAGADQDFIPVKTGTGMKLMKNGPRHIMDAEDYEPLYVPQDNILEECLRREAERVAHQENLMNRVVYDSVDPAPNHLANQESSSQQQQISENEQLNNQESEDSNIYSNSSGQNNLLSADPKQCDNDQNLTAYYVPKSADDYTLVFESRFESGNLRRAIQVYEFEYDLILKPDYGTRGNTQWYYFRVQNMRPGRTYRFNIINLLKPDSLYNHGMQPLMYSEIEARKLGKGWHRTGRDVCYYQNSMKRKTQGNYYTLTFSVKFPHESDTVYFAHSYPYTFSDLQRYLNRLETDPRKKLRFRRKVLCQTLAGNNVDMLIITSFAPAGVDGMEQLRQRRGVVISSRVHPGETGASYMVKGVIDYLVGPSLGARILRDNFVFKIVPMLNPDGVINGNTRCNLAGVDLNRQWIEPSKKLHPSIFHTKQMIKKFQEDREVFLVCDIHGHSRKKNIFMYGNSVPKNDKYKERLFPFLLEKQADTFSYADCSFAVQKSKEATARVVIWRELGIQNSFTLEASFCGADFGRYADLHFNTDMLQEIAHRFCETIIQYCQLDAATIKQLLEDIERLNNEEAEEQQPVTSGQGILNDNGGGLATIKDEDSNADSDFSGDEGQPSTQQQSGQPGQLKPPDNASLASSGMPNGQLQLSLSTGRAAERDLSQGPIAEIGKSQQQPSKAPKTAATASGQAGEDGIKQVNKDKAQLLQSQQSTSIAAAGAAAASIAAQIGQMASSSGKDPSAPPKKKKDPGAGGEKGANGGTKKKKK